MTTQILNANMRSLPKRSATPLALTAINSQLDRILCMSCHGYGADEQSAICTLCQEQGFCQWHKCKMCLGRGVVCPRCRGMRFVRSGTPGYMTKGNSYIADAKDDGHKNTAVSMFNSAVCRCELCCEGNQVNPIKEFAAIKTYIASPNTGEWSARANLKARQDADELRYRFISRYMKGQRKRWYGKGATAEELIREEAQMAWEEALERGEVA